MELGEPTRENVSKRRFALALAGALGIAAGTWVVFTYVVSDPQLALEYVRALIWPAVVAAGLFWLRAPLREKLRQLLRLEGFGTSMEFQEMNRRLEVGLAPAFEQLGATGGDSADLPETADAEEIEPQAARPKDPEGEALVPPATIDKAVSTAEHASSVDSAAAPRSVEPLDDLVAVAKAVGLEHILVEQARARFDAEPEIARRRLLEVVIRTAEQTRSLRSRAVKQRADTREGIEEVIRNSADWGYAMGRAGAPKTVPDVEWNEDGTWRIVTEVPKRRPSVPANQESGSLRSIKALEDEIKTLEKARHSPFSLAGFKDPSGDESWLRELKRRLAKIDPGNPWT